MLSVPLLLGLLACLLTVALCPPVIVLMRAQGAINQPEDRSLHSLPTPRGGGMAPATAALVVGAAAVFSTGTDRLALGLLVAGAGLAAVGLGEDLYGIAPPRRLALQVAAALVAASLLAPNLLVGLLVAGWLVGYANAFNFMDGINGISAASVTLTGATWAVAGALIDSPLLVVASAVLVGAAIGFWPFNAPVARVFPGDVGSYFFGAALAALGVVALTAGVPWLTVLGPLVVVLADTGTTLARRVLVGEPWHLPHKTHVYQRLVTRGWSHLSTTLVVTGFGAVCAALGLLGGPVAATGMLVVVVGYVLLPRLVATTRTRTVPVPRPQGQEGA